MALYEKISIRMETLDWAHSADGRPSGSSLQLGWTLNGINYSSSCSTACIHKLSKSSINKGLNKNPKNNTPMTEKQTLRQRIAQEKRLHSLEERAERSALLWPKIEEHPLFAGAHTILLYYSLPDEVCTHHFVERCHRQLGKRVLLPVVVGDDLELRLYEGADSLREGAFHILEPTGPVFTQYDEIDLALVPGVSFDAEGHRLGRGKGYYDRLLPRLSCPTLGICFRYQLSEHIPVEAHDCVMSQVITETQYP
jgi:5-formyltetrahydrofolate cyclo-ligase